ncbi:hypothetical protein AVEN_110715-1 [Araneus ventricosus]|uniref:Uncharacterized protein n=1 Tax=Araneus ventricosus TaxID=182803 RepID=A0A4Y2AWF4_ARAVE|nr:hypothetical protein AVEN_110715-1 [Araneus ventricosus]
MLRKILPFHLQAVHIFFYFSLWTVLTRNRRAFRAEPLSRPRWPNGKVSASESEGLQVRNPIPLKIRSVLGLLHDKSYVGGQTSYRWCGAEIWKGVKAQVSSSSSDRGPKLQGPSQNRPRVASKWGVNITKLNQPLRKNLKGRAEGKNIFKNI